MVRKYDKRKEGCMNVEKQRLFIEYMMSNDQLLARVSGIVDENYFDPKIRQAVHFIKEYYEQYKSPPKADQVNAELDTPKQFNDHPLTVDEIKYAEDEIEKFCRYSAMERAILASPKHIEKGDFGKVETMIKDAIAVSLPRTIGLDYFANPEERLMRLLQNNQMIPTGYQDIDKHLNGGLNRKEMTVLSANSRSRKIIANVKSVTQFLDARVERLLYLTRAI
jgi:hypothetical protein